MNSRILFKDFIYILAVGQEQCIEMIRHGLLKYIMKPIV